MQEFSAVGYVYSGERIIPFLDALISYLFLYAGLGCVGDRIFFTVCDCLVGYYRELLYPVTSLA